MTQHEQIIDMCKDGEYHCQNAFRALFIFSPHKRRREIENSVREDGKKYIFINRKCEHGFINQFDYKMIEKLEEIKPQIRPLNYGKPKQQVLI